MARLSAWGLGKNLKRRDWRDVDRVVQKRKRLGIDSDVYVDGIFVPPKKLRKEATRGPIDAVARSHQERMFVYFESYTH